MQKVLSEKDAEIRNLKEQLAQAKVQMSNQSMQQSRQHGSSFIQNSDPEKD